MKNITFKIKRDMYNGVPLWTVYPQGYDHGRGFSTLEKAFDFMRAVLRNS